MTTIITNARVDCADGRVAAYLTLTPVGGGTQVKTVDGAPEEVTHPSSEVWNVHLVSPDPMLPGKAIAVTDGYDAAVKVGEAWAAKIDAAAADMSEIAAELAP